MTMNPRGSFFDRLFGPGFDRLFGPEGSNFWNQRAAWETQKAAWKAQRHAQRAAWKAANDGSTRGVEGPSGAPIGGATRGPFAMVWGLLWTVFWLGFLVLLVVSPEFRTGFINFMLEIPKFVVHLLHTIVGRAEI